MARSIKVRIRQDLHDQAADAARAAGFATTEEFIEHAIEQALTRSAAAQPEATDEQRAEIERRLKGMGYL